MRLLTALAAACAAFPSCQSAVQESPGYSSRYIRIKTEPEGAHITVNGEYVGRSPARAKVRINYNRILGRFDPLILNVEAAPSERTMELDPEARYVQTRQVVAQRPSEIPGRMFFQMGLHSPTPVVRVENH